MVNGSVMEIFRTQYECVHYEAWSVHYEEQHQGRPMLSWCIKIFILILVNSQFKFFNETFLEISLVKSGLSGIEP